MIPLKVVIKEDKIFIIFQNEETAEKAYAATAHLFASCRITCYGGYYNALEVTLREADS